MNLDAHQDPESLRQDPQSLRPEQQSLHSSPYQVQGPDKDEAEHQKRDPDPPYAHSKEQEVDQNPAGTGRDSVFHQDPDQTEHHGHTSPVQDRGQTPANQEAGGSVPALVITQAEESLWQTPGAPADPGPSCIGDGGDMACSDLLSLRSDSFSLTSEQAASRTSEEDDSRSVAASSVLSLFHRVPLDPLEKHWWRSSALGNMAAQRQLLLQDPGLVLKKDFVSGTALHWAAKHGHQEAVDMMLRSGADVNVRSHGYTALHLASIHGHQHIVNALITAHNAKTSVRDYHGKTAVHYWTGCSNVFNKPQPQPGGSSFVGRRTQRYALPSLLLTRSRSQGQLDLGFGPPPLSATHDALDLHV
ncbi:ankyrin repeat domain-containing protein SOWAHC isoform X2 [Sander lucioperca]|uniref:ankyrin repeat domain-containing protein SOWAHC isoform X2 n=1 Tax=Sander lucioperca TaxID=283035 RepID=UPI00165343BC|nr:ankyrin repeat domain-containing protein SOWAHC isoform X2 [Sander lucioperca]